MGSLFDFKSSNQSGTSGPAQAQLPFLRHMWSSAASMRQLLENRMGIGQTALGGAPGSIGREQTGTGIGSGLSNGIMDMFATPMVNTNYGGVGGTPATGAPATGGAGPQQMTMPDRYAQGLFGQGMNNLNGASSAMNPFAQQGYGGLQMQGLQNQLQQQLGGAFGQIRDAAQMAGGFGGSGMGIQQNQAIQDAGRTLFQGAGGIMQQDLMRQQQAAQAGAGFKLDAASQMPGMYNLAVNSPMQSLFMPLAMQYGVNTGFNSSNNTARDTGFGICHVARLVYGDDNPQWIEFYHWKESRPAFKAVYDRYAERVAQWLADKPRLQTVIRRWMDWAVR
jgi:hypothetical protein